MDNIECLKKFTEDTVKKQNDSMESLKKLSQAIDTVNSDVANLINSLQMVGNRQFAENRIHEDDSLTGGGGGGCNGGYEPTNIATQQQKQIYNSNNNKHVLSSSSPLHSQTFRPISPQAVKSADVDIRLTLCDILHKAIELLPPSEDECEDEYTDDQEEYEGDKEEGLLASRPSPTQKPPSEDEDEDDQEEGLLPPPPSPPQPQPPPPHRLPDKIEPMDRDRVANILKKYSLYDEDDDDVDDDYNYVE